MRKKKLCAYFLYLVSLSSLFNLFVINYIKPVIAINFLFIVLVRKFILKFKWEF